MFHCRLLFNKLTIVYIVTLLSLSGIGYAQDVGGLGQILTGTSTEADKQADAPPDRVIATNNNAQDDQKIKKRLTQIFSELDALKQIEITVRSGVVGLSGLVPSAKEENRALQFARQIEGVVGVENNLTVDRSLQRRLDSTQNRLTSTAKEILANLPILASALGLLVFFWLIGSWIAKRKALYHRLTPNPFIAELTGQLTRLVFIVTGLVLALDLLDARPLLGTILGAAGLLSLSISFAVRDTVENYIASILLSLRNPFQTNDLIKINDFEGQVARLNSRATILISPDGNHIRIPNAIVYKAIITNYTRNPKRRFSFIINIDANQPLLPVQSLAVQTLSELKGVLNEPKPSVLVKELSDGIVQLECSGWVDQTLSSHARVRSQAIRHIKEVFEDHGIAWPDALQRIELSRAPSGVQPNDLVQQELEQAEADYSQELSDVSIDNSLQQHVNKEQDKDSENLLQSNTPKE